MTAMLGGSAIASAACIVFASGGWTKVEFSYVPWTLMPYLVLVAAYMGTLFSGIQNPARALLVWATVVVALTGPLLYADALFWHVDAQGALAILMVPVIQVALTVFLFCTAAIWQWRIKQTAVRR